MIVEVQAGIDLHGIAESKILQAGRQLFGSRHFGAADQNRNDRHAPAQGCFHLDADGIGLLLNARVIAIPAEPLWSDDGEQDIGLEQRLINVLAEIDA